MPRRSLSGRPLTESVAGHSSICWWKTALHTCAWSLALMQLCVASICLVQWPMCSLRKVHDSQAYKLRTATGSNDICSAGVPEQCSTVDKA